MSNYDCYLINIENVENGIPMGHIMNPCIREMIAFNSLEDSITKINYVLQWINIEIKKYGTENLPIFHSFRNFSFHKKTKYFFLIQIIRMDDTSWHGLIEGSGYSRQGFKNIVDLTSKIEWVIGENRSKSIKGQ